MVADRFHFFFFFQRMSTVSSIRVTPAVGEFSDVEPGMIFVIPFTIHNVSSSVKRVRFGPPKTPCFRLINTQQSIAPGMKQIVEVEFTSKELKEAHDFLTIKTEEGELQIPLHAWFPAANIVCDPVIELGRVSLQHPVESTVYKMKNIGRRDGVFKFVDDASIQGLSLVPQSGVVPAGKCLDVLVHYFPTDTGNFRGSFSLQIDQQPTRLIEVVAEVVESRVGVLDPKSGESLSRLAFGKLFFGQQMQKTVHVRNFSEHTVSFTMRPLEDHDAATDNDETSSRISLPFECSPKEGRIVGKGTCAVTVTFAPQMVETKRGWEHSHVPVEELAKSWDLPFVIEVVETEQRIDLQIAGKATPTLVTLSESHFRFPECAVNDHSDFLFSFVNDNPELPCDFSLSRVAHFRCDPCRGVVGPKERQNVLLTFQPNQLGSFRGVMLLTLNGGVKKLPVVLSGTAAKIGPKPPSVGGLDKVREDFVKPLQFARTASSAPAGYAAAIPESAHEAESDEDGAPELLLLSEWQQKKEHNRLYNNFIANSRKVRDYNTKVRQGATLDTNPDDIGMIPAEGLDEPEPKITRREDRLAWTQHEDASAKGEGPSLRKALRVDENKLIKKKFKREPSNLNEVRECKLELSPTDIQNIITPIKVLDFQQVSVYSTNTKSFFVYNGLKTHILVNIPFQRDELALSTPPSQVIPPGQVAGFDIIFRSETVQTFQQAIYFTINETHKLKFVVFAEVIPIDVGVSQKDLQFRFPDFGSDPSVSQQLILTNNGNSNAEFQWGFSNEDPGAFTFAPSSGFVPANGSLPVTVTYTPVLSSIETVCEAVLRVKGSTGVKRVSLNGAVQAAACTWSVKDNKVDFKKIPVGTIRTQTITLKNNGNCSTVYAFDTSGLTSGVTVTPTRGRIPVGGVEDVVVQLRTAVAQAVKCNLSCHIRGMKQLLKAQVAAEAKVPEISIVEPAEGDDSESQLDFGGVYVGSYELRRIQIQNHDEVPAFFKLDLSSYPTFTVYDSDRRAVDLITSDTDDMTPHTLGQVSFYRRLDDNEDAAEIRRSNIYRVAVNAHQSINFFVAFTPTAVGAVEPFVLPLSFAGCDITSEALHPISVFGEGKKPRLVMSPSVVDFGSRVVSRENTSKIPNRILVRLTNETDADLPWELTGKHHDSMTEVFRVEPTSGRLPPGQSSQVQFTFTPSEVKAFSARYSIFLDGNKETKYMDIVAKGFGSNPLLTFDRKELILPPVPLDVVTKTTFFVSNDGYESLDLRYKVAGDGKLPVTLAFPDGQTITSNHNVLPVEVSFASKKPMTFTVNIDFFDDMEGIFSIPVTCTADNSLLTTYGYVKYREGSWSLAAENEKKPLIYSEADDNVDKETTPRQSRDGSSAVGQEDSVGSSFQVLDQVLKKTLTKRSIDRLRNWININLLHESVEDLVATLQANQGKVASEIIEQLFGKNPASVKADTGASTNTGKGAEKPVKKDAANVSAVEPFDTLLLFLKQYGACVSEIRSEFLLRYDDYCRLPVDSRSSTKLQQSKGAKLPERRFAARSLHAWSTLMFQVIRIFYFSRITWKALKASPFTIPLQQASASEKWSSLSAEPSCIGSNLYSPAECTLLKWLSVHLVAVYGNSKAGSSDKKKAELARIANFESDVRDCKAYAACLVSYIPPLAPKFDSAKENGFVLSPASSTELERNASILLEAMRDYGLDFKVSGREFLDFGGRDHLLFAAYLFNSLPQYIPKTTVRFRGKLLERISKQIEITNPTKWAIDYVVSLDGSDEFKLAESKLHLEPKATGSFTIFVTPRFSKRVEGRCMFLNSRGGAFAASTMVFNLETEIEQDSSFKTIDNLETPMYEVLNNEIMIENPFSQNGQFGVQIFQEYVKSSDRSYPEEASLTMFPDAFWSPVDTLSIKKNEKAKFVFQFLPCVRGQYRARVTFKDDKVGEFAYVFVGNCLPPKPFDTINVQTEAAVATTKEISLPFRNLALEKALQQKEERFKIFKGSRKNMQPKETDAEGKETTYKLDFVNEKFVGPNPFYNGPKQFAVKPEPKDDDDAQKRKGRSDKLQGQTLNVTFTPKGPGTYNGYLLLTSTWDVRVISIEGKSRSPGMKGELEFACPARQQITQEIPITNTSEKEWVISAQLTGDHFSGPRELRVPSGRSKTYTLLFNPQWICDVLGQLVLKNNDTQEKYTYTLKGKAEEPLAENTIPVECKARETRKITINVPNITFDEVTYAVETDLPFVAGDPRITVAKMEVGKYTLSISPQISGKTTGSITFIAPNKQYVWFVLQLTVLRPPPEDTVTIEAEVRKGAVAEITISNPTNRLVDFTVRRKGEGLHGDDLLTIEPSQSAVYQLAFAPVKSGTVDGVISFNNDDIGEFWYRLALIGKDAAPQVLNFQCEIGKSAVQEITLENPLDVECTMISSNSNEVNFNVTPSQLVLKPNGSAKATVSYIPSAMQSGQDSTIKFVHNAAGVWEFKCRGTGLPPTKMDAMQCTSQVGRLGSMSVTFRNPFPVPKKFALTLQSADYGVFSLMQKRSNITLGPFQSTQISVSYQPMTIASHSASVVVQLMPDAAGADVSDLIWEFPLIGTAEFLSTDVPPRLTCKARKQSTTHLVFDLEGFQGDAAHEEFETELCVGKDVPHQKAILSSLSFERTDSAEGSSTASIRYEFRFSPLRPFTSGAEFLVKKKSGGAWRFPLMLESTPPDVDDVIVMEAAVNATTTVSFQLYNVLPHASSYQAYFTSDSPQEFSVNPTKGVLPPMPSSQTARGSGTQFSVSFVSSQYGKTLVGNLIVDTDDMQWRFEVRGTLPKYQPPTNVVSKVQNRLRPETESVMRRAAQPQPPQRK